MTPWDRLVGHERQKALWLSMRGSGKLPHALLLTGPPGIGKRAWALAAAQDLLCHHPGREGPCGRCPSCQAIAHRAHPDLMEIAPERGHRELRVEELEPVQDWLALTPALGERKALILDQAEAATPPTAPSLLKVIEEPPEGTHFFLVTARPGAIVPTIASRCRRLSFAPLTREAFRKALPDLPAKEEESLYLLGRGSPGEALRLREEGLLDLREALAGLVGMPYAKALETAGKVLIPPKPSAKEAADQETTPTEIRRQAALERLQILVSLLRDRLPGVPADARLHPDLAVAPAIPGVGTKIRAVTEAMDTILGNADLTLALECCCLRLAATPQR